MSSSTASHDLLAARYRAAAGAIPAEWNETLTTLLSHRSVRAYLPTALPPGTLDILVAAAQSAASSSNLQVWSVIAVEDPERKARLSEHAGGQGHIRQAPLFLVWLADLARLGHIAATLGVPADGLAYLESLIVGIVDTALAAQNAVVAAESLGLGTVYIGAIRNNPEKVAAEINLPPHVMPVFGLCVGHPDPARPAAIKPRLPQAAVLHREHYALAAQEDAIQDYNRTMRAFQAEQDMTLQDWTQQVTNRVKSAQALNGRDRMREALANLGFELR